MGWISKLFQPLGVYSLRQRRGFLALVPLVLLFLLGTQLWKGYSFRKIKVDTTDYWVLRQWVAGLKDSLMLASEAASGSKGLNVSPIWQIPKEDLNAATALELQRTEGIGIVLSRRIVLYREALGGFCKLKQLEEVWGLPKKVRLRLQKRYDIRCTVLPLYVNRWPAEALAEHPYVSRVLAQQIVAARPFIDVEDFKKRLVLSDKEWYSLQPYVSFVP